MRGRSLGVSSLVYPATFPLSNHLIHLAGRHCPSLQGRSRSTSPRFSLYPGGASSKGCFVSTHRVGRLVHWRPLRPSSMTPSSTPFCFSSLLLFSTSNSLIPLS